MSYTEIDRPDLYFNTKLYTGTGATQSISGIGFQPDWTVIKRRNSAGGHFNFDVIRGATKRIAWNETSAEETQTENLQSFDSDGFTVGNASGINGSGDTHVAWNWLAGGTASSNTDGSITSQVSASTTSGFSIVSYTGTGANATVGHGLGSAPNVIIWKKRSATGVWRFWHHSVPLSGGEYQQGNLNSTDAFAPFGATNVMNGTAPTSTVFSLDTADYNESSATYISYCFAEKKGFSKFGSYTGNGNASDGTFVYTGFKPSFVMVKASSRTGDWYLMDNKRDPINSIDLSLSANSSNADNNQGNFMDFLSNGFKLYLSGFGLNESGSTYIYMAFAENPFTTSTGIPTTAR